MNRQKQNYEREHNLKKSLKSSQKVFNSDLFSSAIPGSKCSLQWLLEQSNNETFSSLLQAEAWIYEPQHWKIVWNRIEEESVGGGRSK